MKKIPKVIHVYWGSAQEQMSYLRYSSLFSIKKHSIGWKIKLHIPAIPGGAAPWKTGEQKSFGKLRENYFEDAKKLVDEVVVHDFEQYGFSNSAHEVHKADFIRWKLLTEEGGFWSDMDILYFASLDELKFSYQTGDTEDIDTVIHIYPDYKSHAIGLLGSVAGNRLFSACRDRAEKRTLGTYQAIGADILNDEFLTIAKIEKQFPELWIGNLTKSSVYHVSPMHIKKLFDSGIMINFAADSIGCHWFGGHQLAAQFEHEAYSIDSPMSNNTVASLLRKVGAHRI